MKDGTKRFYECAIGAAVQRICAGLGEALNLTELSSIADVSPLHFHRIFRGMVGETPLELHRRLRLERAAFRLSASDEPVTTIAFESGFETHESFTRAFQGAYALAPTAFRRRIRLHRERMGVPEALPFELPARSGIHFRADGGLPIVNMTLGGTDVNVIVEDLPERRILAVTHVGPNTMIGEAFRQLASIAGPMGLMARGVAVAIFHDDPEMTPAADLRSSAGLIVANDVATPDGLEEVRIPAGKYARATHVGHYATLRDSWDRLMGSWLPTSGYRVAARYAYEVYRIADHSRPHELETDLYIAIE